MLDSRKSELLSKMAIDVWRLRESNDTQSIESIGPDSTVNTVAGAAAPEQVGVESLSLASDSVAKPASLEVIAELARNCTKCSLSETRTHAVPGEGNSNAKWVFVGEAPGYNEDQQGRPFVGRAGQLLDSMIQALGMKRGDVFIANVVKCRPPDNRDPRAEEVSQCAGYLHQQLSLINPDVIVALGRVSAQRLLDSEEPMAKLRHTVHRFGKLQIPLVATYHPAYLLRRPLEKSKAWEDLLIAKTAVSS